MNAIDISPKRILTWALTLPMALFLSCQGGQEDAAPDCTGLVLTVSTKTNTSCGANTGSVQLTATGGEGPYRFARDNGSLQSASLFGSLAAGNYQFKVIDSNDCSASLNVSIESAEGVVITSLSTDPAGCKEQKGKITVTASAGKPPYQYRLGSGNFQTSNAFTGVAAGPHTILVRDSENCDFTQTTQVLSGVSYSKDVAAIISSNCAISGCHAGAQGPDLRTFASIKSSAERIKVRTGNRTMPVGRALSQQEIDLIACWVDDGAIEN